jgi:hypothetical protein
MKKQELYNGVPFRFQWKSYTYRENCARSFPFGGYGTNKIMK